MHEFLKAENYYESNSVSRGRGDYTCSHCGEDIAKGEPSTVHKFYPEFEGWRTHPACNQPFIDSLRPEEEPTESDEEHVAELIDRVDDLLNKYEGKSNNDNGSEIKMNI